MRLHRKRGAMYKAAKSGGVTQLYRVIDLVDSGASPERIKEWCEKQIRRERTSPSPACGVGALNKEPEKQ